MDVKEYIPLAMRTRNLDSREKQLIHGSMGLVSEVGEVAGIIQKTMQGHVADRTAFALELGDVCWMIAELIDALGISHDTVYVRQQDMRINVNDAICRLAYRSSAVVNLMNTATPKSTLAEYMSDIFGIIDLLAVTISRSLSEVMEMNIEKLRARYPDGFSEERSVKRSEYANGLA